MKMLPRRRGPSQFTRAADGSMTLLEHLQELRSRLFKASLGVAAGMIIGWFLSGPVLNFITQPYCDLMAKRGKPVLGEPGQCNLLQTGLTDVFTLKLQLALWIGLIFAGPVWLYQLWAFVAPGLRAGRTGSPASPRRCSRPARCSPTWWLPRAWRSCSSSPPAT